MRYPMRLSTLGKPLLALFGGVQSFSYVDLVAGSIRFRFGMFDETFRHVMDWGLGFIVDSKRYGPETVPYGFGPHASSRTFGHGGAESSIGFADPEAGLVVAWVANGMPGEARHNRRNRAINAAIYEDLGLIG